MRKPESINRALERVAATKAARGLHSFMEKTGLNGFYIGAIYGFIASTVLMTTAQVLTGYNDKDVDGKVMLGSIVISAALGALADGVFLGSTPKSIARSRRTPQN